MKVYEHLEVHIIHNGTIRVYGNGGLVYEAQGNNIKSTISLFPKQSQPSGEVHATNTKNSN